MKAGQNSPLAYILLLNAKQQSHTSMAPLEDLLACRKLIIMVVVSHSESGSKAERHHLSLFLRLIFIFPANFFPAFTCCVHFCVIKDMTDVKPKEESRGDEAQGPDGGWGWVLVGAMFVSTSLVFGLMRSLGIFFVEFVHYFDESAQAISWISSTGLAAQQFFSKSECFLIVAIVISMLWTGSYLLNKSVLNP